MLDLISLCRDQRIPFLLGGHHHSTVGWVQLNCPFCGDFSDGWHLGWAVSSGVMNCWRCGKHQVMDWLFELYPSRPNVVRDLWRRYQVSSSGIPAKKKAPVKTRKREAVPPNGCGEMRKIHWEYLKLRGFNPEKLRKEWDLRGTSQFSGIWNWRIIAPIRDIAGRIVAYTGRAVSPENFLRWRTSKDSEIACNPKSLIYGIEKVRPEKGVVIVEGPADVWKLGPGAVALLGIDWKIEQALLLRHFKRRYIMFDPESVAQKRAKELAYWLSAFPGETWIISETETDAGDMSEKNAKKIMQELGL